MGYSYATLLFIEQHCELTRTHENGCHSESNANRKGVNMTHDPASKMVELRFVFQGIQERKEAERQAAATATQTTPQAKAKTGYRV